MSRREDDSREPAGLFRWLCAGGVIVLAAVVLALLGRLTGFRSPVFAFNLHFVAMGAASGIDRLLAPRLEGPRFDVSEREVRVYRKLGVVGFMAFLQQIRWNAAMRDPRVFDGTRSTLVSYERATRHGENAHLWIALCVFAPTFGAALLGWWDFVAWICAMSVVLHVYPIMLQRFQRVRLTALIRRLERKPPGVRSA